MSNIDAISAPGDRVPFQAHYLDKMLEEESTVVLRPSGSSMHVRHEYLGLLGLPTGRVVACDPMWLKPVEPFTVEVEPGDYPVVEIQVHRESEGCKIGAGHLLRIADQPTATWEMALRPGQSLRHLRDRHFYGFGVDSGLGCLMDAAAQRPLIDYIDGDLHRFVDELPFDEEFTVPGTEHNLFAFPCRNGDGSYPTWIGRDADGAVTCFLSDMLVIDNDRSRTGGVGFDEAR